TPAPRQGTAAVRSTKGIDPCRNQTATRSDGQEPHCSLQSSLITIRPVSSRNCRRCCSCSLNCNCCPSCCCNYCSNYCCPNCCNCCPNCCQNNCCRNCCLNCPQYCCCNCSPGRCCRCWCCRNSGNCCRKNRWSKSCQHSLPLNRKSCPVGLC